MLCLNNYIGLGRVISNLLLSHSLQMKFGVRLHYNGHVLNTKC